MMLLRLEALGCTVFGSTARWGKHERPLALRTDVDRSETTQNLD
jgi:hypothetical protein